jgi:aminoglycoside phosphotransferase family enzyme/predicted kinase
MPNEAERAGEPWGELPPLIAALLRPEAYPHPVQPPIRCLQTHISWVLLTGGHAYKIRKPVNLGFLDFTSLEQRRRDCLEELRLNRRLSAELYEGVVAIGGNPQQPRLLPLTEANGAEDSHQGNQGTSAAADQTLTTPPMAALEYAVRMREFPQQDLLPAALQRGAIGTAEIETLADDLARFHAGAAIAPADGPYGTPEAVLQPVHANGACLEPLLAPALRPQLEQLRRWEHETHTQLRPRFSARLAAGRVREGHGDLHLGNMLLRQGRIRVFDCLEFSPTLRWIDVISDMAFLVMDLEERGGAALANRLLNRWLEWSGDYDGLALWRWYVSYRAMVRAKVAALSGDRSTNGAVAAYLGLALHQQQQPQPWLLLCHGLSGSGKSHRSAELAAALGAIRLRSDVERKRWFGLWGEATADRRSGDPYALAVSEELFSEHLPQLAEGLLQAGFPVIVDATFLVQRHRSAMHTLAERLGVPLRILDLATPEPLLRQRLQQRWQARSDSGGGGGGGGDPSDADQAVLERQLQYREPLSPAERRLTLSAPPELTTAELATRLLRSLERDG